MERKSCFSRASIPSAAPTTLQQGEARPGQPRARSKARIYDSLLYRHWNEWQSKRRQHLLAMNIDGTEVRDLTPGMRDVPPFSLGGPDEYAISPDSNEARVHHEHGREPRGQHQFRHLHRPNRRRSEAKKITTSPGADDAPLYSPDGKYLAFRSQAARGI
jgi:hypothetical protein